WNAMRPCRWAGGTTILRWRAVTFSTSCGTCAGTWGGAATPNSWTGCWQSWAPAGGGWTRRGSMAERLRIAQVAPIAAPVRPDSTRSIEQLVSLLTEELVRRGHDVTLFATGDSQTSAALRAVYPRGYEEDEGLRDWRAHETLHAAAAFEQ